MKITYSIIRTHRVDEYRHLYGDEYIIKNGHWRPELSSESEKYLKCGIPKFGFAQDAWANSTRRVRPARVQWETR